MRPAVGAALIVALVAGVLTGCGNDEAGVTTTTTTPTTTTTLPPQPPCYGYDEVDEVPVLGGLAMGESHPSPIGGEFDLTGVVGCQVGGVVVTVTPDGVPDGGYYTLACDALDDGSGLPEQFQPPDASWTCIESTDTNVTWYLHPGSLVLVYDATDTTGP